MGTRGTTKKRKKRKEIKSHIVITASTIIKEMNSHPLKTRRNRKKLLMRNLIKRRSKSNMKKKKVKSPRVTKNNSNYLPKTTLFKEEQK